MLREVRSNVQCNLPVLIEDPARVLKFEMQKSGVRGLGIRDIIGSVMDHIAVFTYRYIFSLYVQPLDLLSGLLPNLLPL
jgi:hypothetical protein